jgi:hypothetical protein
MKQDGVTLNMLKQLEKPGERFLPLARTLLKMPTGGRDCSCLKKKTGSQAKKFTIPFYNWT